MFEIGTSLREARLRQALDFPEAEQATKIRGKYLRALEDEQFDVLPAQTYVKGFLRSYAEYLGLDGQLYVDEYNSRYVVGEEETPFRPRQSSVGARSPRIQSRVVLLTLLGIGLVTALVIVAWTRGEPQKQSIPGLSGAATTTPAAAPVVETPKPKAAPKLARLEIVASRGSCWLQVHRGSATGRILFQGTLDRGEHQLFVGRRLWIDVGVPEVITAKLNGKVVRFPTGGPKIVLVTPRGIKPVTGV